jgi:hypothetical protein
VPRALLLLRVAPARLRAPATVRVLPAALPLLFAVPIVLSLRHLLHHIMLHMLPILLFCHVPAPCCCSCSTPPRAVCAC